MAIASAFACSSVAAAAESFLIRNARVHTLTAAGTLEGHDVLVENGRITRIARGISPPAGVAMIDAGGRPLTPGTFGGIGRVGIEEIGLEASTADYAIRLGEMRPEFDVRLAFNPASAMLGVHRTNGVTFAVVAPSAATGGSILAGQGGAVPFDGGAPLAARALFVDVGGDANALAGGSRAGQYMLLRQAFIEARAPNLVLVHDDRLLTPAGRQALLEFVQGAGPFVIDVDRASDIRQVIAFAAAERLRVVIQGGAEAAAVAPELAAAGIAVFLDPLDNLPRSFDMLGASLTAAARLHAAGVRIGFSLRSNDAQDAGKVRQAAGNAVAHGLPWDVALAAITRVPAEVFGVADRFGTLEAGRPAEFVLWSGDPLDVTSLPALVVTGGVRQPLVSRHTLLRDRYLERVRAGAAR
jgi:hypothetical protein